MPISIDQFRSAAKELGDNSIMHLSTDKKSGATDVVTGKWKQFCASIVDVFSKEKTVANRHREVLRAFEASVRAHYGEKLADSISSQLITELKGRPLTGRDIRSTLASIEKHGGQHWLQNERLINQFAHTVLTPTQKSVPSLSSVVNPITESIVNEALNKGLSQQDGSGFLLKYTTSSSQAGVGFSMPDVSKAIEYALRKAMIVTDSQGESHYRRLAPDEARAIASQAARQTILSKVNMRMGANYLQQHPFQEAFDKKCQQIGLSSYRNHMLPDEVKNAFFMKLQDKADIVSMDDMPQFLDQVLTHYFNRQQKKLDQIAALKLPDGNAKGNLTADFMSTRSRISPEYLAQLGENSNQFKNWPDQASSPKEQCDRIMKLIRDMLEAARTKAGVLFSDELGNFVSRAYLIYASKASKEDLEALTSWVNSGSNQQVQKHLMNIIYPEPSGNEPKEVASIEPQGVTSIELQEIASDEQKQKEVAEVAFVSLMAMKAIETFSKAL